MSFETWLFIVTHSVSLSLQYEAEACYPLLMCWNAAMHVFPFMVFIANWHSKGIEEWPPLPLYGSKIVAFLLKDWLFQKMMLKWWDISEVFRRNFICNCTVAWCQRCNSAVHTKERKLQNQVCVCPIKTIK